MKIVSPKKPKSKMFFSLSPVVTSLSIVCLKPFLYIFPVTSSSVISSSSLALVPLAL